MKKIDDYIAELKAKGVDLHAEILANCIEVGECLEWLGPMGSGRNSSTPILRKRAGGRCQNLPVVRILWEEQKGPIPKGKIVYRHCCSDRCLFHLRLGVRGAAHRERGKQGLMKHTPAARAAITRGARRRPSTTCSEQLAAEIRRLVAAGSTDDQISALTSLSPSVVSDVRLGKSWKPTVAVGSVFAWRPGA